MSANSLDTRRLLIFLGFAFGLAWLTALVLALNGGLANSPEILPGIPLAVVLVAGPYMWAPALAHLLTRLITREGWRDTGLRPVLAGWPYWLAAWVLPGLLTVAGLVVYFGLFPQHFDPTLGLLRDLLAQSGQAGLIDPWTVVALQIGQAILIAPLINSVFTFGEEFGWRAYLQPKLMALGPRRAMLLMGLIWGVWHWPVIVMGHNYGLDYPGAPWLGPLAMVWFTFVCGTVLGWLTVRGGSVWPAVIGHAAINGIAGLGALFIQGEPNPVLGPLPVGVIGGLPWALLTLGLLLVPAVWRARTPPTAGQVSPAPAPAPALGAPPAEPASRPAPTRPEQLDDSRYTH